MKKLITSYLDKLHAVTNEMDWSPVEELAENLYRAVINKRRVYICGNGGSAGNAVHLANDFLYGISPKGKALNIEALSANQAVITCLGNDIGYENIYSHQLLVKGQPGDTVIVLSGSGNSANILRVLEVAKQKDIHSFAILGFSGGKAKSLAECAIHFPVDDMQISEDLQMVTGHMLMQFLCEKLSEE